MLMNDDFFSRKSQFFDHWAPNYDCLLTTVFYQSIHKRLLEYVTLPHYPHVLDLGCGTGRLLNRLATQFTDLRGTGLDLSAKMLQVARQQNRYSQRLIFIQGNAESLPFADRQFDVIFNTISFLHYPDPIRVFSEVKRVLKPNGCFYLVDYTVKRELIFPFSPGGLKFYSPQKRQQLATEVGLNIVVHHYLLGKILLTIFIA